MAAKVEVPFAKVEVPAAPEERLARPALVEASPVKPVAASSPEIPTDVIVVDCEFGSASGVDCELLLCAKIAAKVRTMQPNTSCMAGAPLDDYRSRWLLALRAIDNYAGFLRRSANVAGYQRVIAQLKLCQTPQWFRSCSN